ncbi:hypothetical protein R1sor_004890 [Riccia sorocarpa]|uniref:Uncharacterized protein n=1 Tax=Riccia sorocarpa TaxID=122646 RepID=A0ABD3HLV5_9MARC
MASFASVPTELVVGDNVLLNGSSGVLAVGCVHSVDPDDACQGTTIGRGRFSVQLITALNPSHPLPYPNIGADCLAEAVNSYVLWDISHAKITGKVQSSTTAPVQVGGENGDTEAGSINGTLLLKAGPSSVPTSRTSASKKAKDYGPADEYYFKLRENWSNVEVLLLSIPEDEPIAEDVNFRPFSDSCIDGVEVGEQFAGVLVSAVFEDVDPATCMRPMSIRIQEGPCEDAVPLGKRKRSYNSSKRTKPDPAESLSRNASKKKLIRCSQENVSDALKVRCPCTSDFLRKVSHKDVLDERTFFYNEPYTKKVEYILGKFDHPGFAYGKMLFVQGQTVCKPAFWIIYGFVWKLQTFYNYEAAFKMGQRVGFHGNNGTLKPKDTTLFAKASLKTFFKQTAEPLPHIECKNDETDGVTYRLPKTYSREDVYAEVREKMIAVNMAPISKVALENIWKKDFPNYGIHNSSAFAKCAKCIYFMNMLHRERRSAERAKWEHQREMHLKHQMSGRTMYYTHRGAV